MNGSPQDELRAAIDTLSEERAKTLLGWLRMDGRQHEQGALPAGEQTLGPLADTLGITGVVREAGHSVLRCRVDPAFYNPNGVFHGGVVYTLVDYSMGGAVQYGLPAGEHCATIEVKISYLAPVREGTLTAEANVIRQGRNIAFVESKVTDGQGRLIATASGSMFIFRTQQQEAKG